MPTFLTNKFLSFNPHEELSFLVPSHTGILENMLSKFLLSWISQGPSCFGMCQFEAWFHWPWGCNWVLYACWAAKHCTTNLSMAAVLWSKIYVLGCINETPEGPGVKRYQAVQFDHPQEDLDGLKDLHQVDLQSQLDLHQEDYWTLHQEGIF